MQPSPKQFTTTTFLIILMANNTIDVVNQVTEEDEQIITVATSISIAVTTAKMVTEAAGSVVEQTRSPTTATTGKKAIEKKPEATNMTNVENMVTETATTLLRLCLHYAS